MKVARVNRVVHHEWYCMKIARANRIVHHEWYCMKVARANIIVHHEWYCVKVARANRKLYIKNVLASLRPLFQRQVSLVAAVPFAGVVNSLLGSDSQVTSPLNLRIYLYSKFVFAEIFTATVRSQ
jgi:hypothetical protein